MLTIKDVSEQLKVCQTTVRKMVLSQIPHYKVGGGIRVKQTDLDAWVRSCVRKPWG